VVNEMSRKVFKYIYGPVPSRRLGRSLGLDLVPFKTCSYDCIYCQLGKTTHKTVERRQYVDTAELLAELEEKLAGGVLCDYISFAGSGEPTLYAPLGELITSIREMTSIPIAVITNGSLLHLPHVRRDLASADLVIPSLDAGDRPMFEYVNRPHPDISFEQMVEGLIEFGKMRKNELWLEVLLVSGVTGLAAEAKKIASWAEKIRPNKIQINTVSRPALEDFACAVEAKQLKKLAGLFPGRVEILEDSSGPTDTDAPLTEATDADILNMLARRPSTLGGIARGLGFHPHEAAKRLEALLKTGRVDTEKSGRRVFYKPAGAGL